MSDINAITWEDAKAVTPSDSVTQFTDPAGGFIVQVAGTVHLITARNSTVTVGAAAGVPIALAFKQIMATGTTATGIVALIQFPYKGTGGVTP